MINSFKLHGGNPRFICNPRITDSIILDVTFDPSSSQSYSQTFQVQHFRLVVY